MLSRHLVPNSNPGKAVRELSSWLRVVPGFLTQGTLLSLSPEEGGEGAASGILEKLSSDHKDSSHLSPVHTTCLASNPTFLFLRLFVILQLVSHFFFFLTRKASFPFVCAHELATCTAVCIPV